MVLPFGLTTDVHGSQANKEMDPSPVRAVSVPRRLAQRPPQPECAGLQDGSLVHLWTT